MKKPTVSKVIGFPPNNSMAQVNGLDDIDKWAANVGMCRKQMKEFALVAKSRKQQHGLNKL